MRHVAPPLAATLFLILSAAYGCSGNTNDGSLGLGADEPMGGDSGSSTDPGNGGTSNDGSSSSGSDAASGGGGGDAGAAHDGAVTEAGSDAGACIKAVASPGSGHHHAGADCSSCHDSLGASRQWTISGTLYNAATGGTAVSGATIEVIDANGQKLALPTYDDGNFYTTQAVAYPVVVRASKCPDNLAMAGHPTKGSCNTSGCHTSAMRIHAP